MKQKQLKLNDQTIRKSEPALPILSGIIFVLITGSLAHFLYDWTGKNKFVGLFTPVNESVWEHMKLLFFPMLVYSLFILCRHRDSHRCMFSSLLFGLLSGTFLIPILFYTYTFLIGRDIFILDIGIFIITVLIAFLLSRKVSLSCSLRPYALFLCCLTGIFLLCFIVFTCRPPKLKIFEVPTFPAAK